MYNNDPGAAGNAMSQLMRNSGLGGLGGLDGTAGGLHGYDPNPQLTAALNRLANALENLKPRVRVKMGRAHG